MSNTEIDRLGKRVMMLHNSVLLEKNQEKLPILVLDIDDTVFRCAYRHFEAWKKLIEDQFLGEATPQLIAWETFKKKGGSRVYKPTIDEAKFQKINSENASSEKLHTDLQPVKFVEEIFSYFSFLIKYFLTARSEKLATLTFDELDQFDILHDKSNLFCAPNDGAYENPVDYKVGKLIELSEQHPSQKIVLVDDSVSTYEAIKKLNNPNIDCILFNGDMTSKEDYPMAQDWREIAYELLKELELIYSELLSIEIARDNWL